MAEDDRPIRKGFDETDLESNKEFNPGDTQFGTGDYRANARKQNENSRMKQITPFGEPSKEQKDAQGGQFDALGNQESRKDANKLYDDSKKVGRTQPVYDAKPAEERKKELAEKEEYARKAFEQKNEPKTPLNASKVVDAARKGQEGREVIGTDKGGEKAPAEKGPAQATDKRAESDADETSYKQFMDENMKSNLQYWLRTMGDVGVASAGGLAGGAKAFDTGYGAVMELARAGLSGNPMSVGSQSLASMASGLAGMSQTVDGLNGFQGVKGPEYYKDRDRAVLAEKYINGTFNNALREAAGDKPLSELGDEELYYVHRKMNRLLKPEWDRIRTIPEEQWTQEDKAFATAYQAVNGGVKERAGQISNDMKDYRNALQGEARKLEGQIRAQEAAEEGLGGPQGGTGVSDPGLAKDIKDYMKNPGLAASRMKLYRGRDNPFQGDDRARFDEAVRRGDMDTVKEMINSSGQATRWANNVSRLRDSMYQAGIDKKYPLNDEDLALANVLHHALRNKPPVQGKPNMIMHRDGSTESVEFGDNGRIIDREFIAKNPQWVRTHPHMVDWKVADEVLGAKTPVQPQNTAPQAENVVPEPEKTVPAPQNTTPQADIKPEIPQEPIKTPVKEQNLEEIASETPENPEIKEENDAPETTHEPVKEGEFDRKPFYTTDDAYRLNLDELEQYNKDPSEQNIYALNGTLNDTAYQITQEIKALVDKGVDFDYKAAVKALESGQPEDFGDNIRELAEKGDRNAQALLAFAGKYKAYRDHISRLEQRMDEIEQQRMEGERAKNEKLQKYLDTNVQTINGTMPIRNVLHVAKDVNQFINLIANGRPMDPGMERELVQLYNSYKGMV